MSGQSQHVINTTNLTDDSVTAPKIATDAVDSAEIKANAVGTSEIATDGVGADEIAAGAVGTSELEDGSVGLADLATATKDGILPWLVNVDVFQTAIAATNWNTIDAGTAGRVYNASLDSGGAQNDEINFDVVLAAGTYTLELMHSQFTNRGIYTVKFGGTSVGTIDGYAGSATHNVRSTITSIAVASTGKIRITLAMATKNASSSAYYGSIQHIQLRRTA